MNLSLHVTGRESLMNSQSAFSSCSYVLWEIFRLGGLSVPTHQIL